MPPEPTKAAKRRSTRRDGDDVKFDGYAREVESKRSRGEISCAECRRLKIKCDKQIPCQSCVRRGCGNLCPNGSLSTGQGTRFVLAATEHLHRRITKISDRVRELEDALAALQAKHSNEPHPLLRSDLLSDNLVDDDDMKDASAPPANPPEIIDAFGTLSISDHGVSRFFGPTGGPESLLMASHSLGPASPASSGSLRSSAGPAALPDDLTMFSQSFPFTPMGPADAVQAVIEGHLPPWARALYLAETYLEHAGWLFRGIARTQLVDDMLPAFYHRRAAPPPAAAAAEADEYNGPHDLALLFVVFAVGAIVDLRQDPSNAEAEHYHQIARAAVCLQPVLEKPSLVTIQTLKLLSVYNAMSTNELGSQETSMETSWSLTTLATHLSQTIGLHRDSARWGLSPKMVERRRILFWDLFVADAWQSLNTGRPPSFSLAYIDCRMPEDQDPKRKDPGDTQPANRSLGARFAMECVSEVAARTLTAETPAYATIIELDRKVRDFPIPDEAAAAAALGPAACDTDLSPSVTMTRCVRSHMREVVLLYIHRSFFAQAIIEHPANPLKSPYAASFLAAYRASATILRTIRDHFAMQPALCARVWLTWTHAFSAAVVFGTIVTRGPRSPFAANAMRELEQACVLFTQASRHSRRASKALTILDKLADKARTAIAAAQHDGPSAVGYHGSMWDLKSEDPEDELTIFSGRTRFVSARKESTLPAPILPPQHAHSAAPAISPPGIVVTPMVASFHPQMAPPPPMSASSSYYSDSSSSSAGWGCGSGGQGYGAPQADPYHSQFQPSYPITPPASLPASGEYCQWQQEYFAPPQQQQQSAYASSAGYCPQPQDAYHRQGQMYTPSFPAELPPPHTQLIDLGLAARDSRLDERWSLFMQDSGLLDGSVRSGF